MLNNYALLFLLLMNVPLEAQQSPLCEYVVEHPKYFPKAKGYFLITGMKDTMRQRITNDSLRHWYNKPTEYMPGRKGEPKGYKNYKAKKGESLWQYRYHCVVEDSIYGIVLKDKDSIQPLGPSGIKGTGAHLCSWTTMIYDTNLLIIIIEYDPKHERDTLEDPLFMDMSTGRHVYPNVSVRFRADRKDSLQRYLNGLAEKSATRSGTWNVDSLIVPDSITLDSWQLTHYYFGNPVPFYFHYVTDGLLLNGTKYHSRRSITLTYSEIEWFTDGKMESDLERYAQPQH